MREIKNAVQATRADGQDVKQQLHDASERWKSAVALNCQMQEQIKSLVEAQNASLAVAKETAWSAAFSMMSERLSWVKALDDTNKQHLKGSQ